MRLYRPYIPLSVRCEVAWRQITEAWAIHDGSAFSLEGSVKNKLNTLLYHLFGDAKVHLDHDPPLMLRAVLRNKKTNEIICYHPDANDPRYLTYRRVEDHKTKTFVRGDGAQRSDMGQRRYLKKVDRNRSGKPKRKITQRKNFKWPKRSTMKKRFWMNAAIAKARGEV